MSVLVRGMEMPKTAGDCSVKIDPDTRRCIYTGKEFEETLSLLLSRRCADCPLVEVQPHGRLVDGDVLMTEVMDSDLDHLQRDDWKEVIQIVQDAPTIIEAEGSENENNNV